MNDQRNDLPGDSGRSRAEGRSGTGVTGGFALLLRRVFRCNRGVAAVEFGLSAPLLLGMLVPAVDLGLAFSTQQQLAQAVQAGAQYAASQPSWNPGAIVSAVTAATSLSGISVSPSPYRTCACPSGGGAAGNSSGIATATCGSTCSNGEIAAYYAFISARKTYTPILPYSLLGGSTNLTAQSIIRIP